MHFGLLESLGRRIGVASRTSIGLGSPMLRQTMLFLADKGRSERAGGLLSVLN